MFKKENVKDNKGFTIIEVLIVLAIAGLILLIVFLAVPALQRNQRNSARNSEAARISAMVTECLANRNGVIASCDANGIGFNGDDFQQFEQIADSDAASDIITANIAYSTICTATGESSQTGVSTRQFTVNYMLETGNGGVQSRCIGSE